MAEEQKATGKRIRGAGRWGRGGAGGGGDGAAGLRADMSAAAARKSLEEADGTWEREMEALCGCMRAAEDAGFQCWVTTKTAMKADASSLVFTGKTVHFAARFGNFSVLNEAKRRTGSTLEEAAQKQASGGSLVLHYAVTNRHLSGTDVPWAISLYAVAASTANTSGDLPLLLMVSRHESLSAELVDALVAAHGVHHLGGAIPRLVWLPNIHVQLASEKEH